MSNNNLKIEPKKGLPGGFLVSLLVLALLFLLVQHLVEKRSGKVAFSHQLESLVNLDLLVASDNKKIALNENLVTFTGRFKDRQSEDSRARYRYLELLNEHKDLEGELVELSEQTAAARQKAIAAADLFLHLSGLELPAYGYKVVSPRYNFLGEDNQIIILKRSLGSTISLADLKKSLLNAEQHPSSRAIKELMQDLRELVGEFRGHALGIGDESIKSMLHDEEERLNRIITQTEPTQSWLLESRHGIDVLETTVGLLNEERQHVRLLPLRSVRAYMDDLEQMKELSSILEKNSAQLAKARQAVAHVTWFFNNQELSTKALEKQGGEPFSHWFSQAKEEWIHFSLNAGQSFKAPDQPRNFVLERTFQSEEPSPNYVGYLFAFLPLLLLLCVLYFVFAKQLKGFGGGPMTFSRSPARLLAQDHEKKTFKDVAGCDEAKEELQEIVEFLKDPEKFTALGARIPKGVLCVGAPGTGKTLIAKAVAGEAGRPFLSLSGSDFVEMFVGVGASRVRETFGWARKLAPCLIFIDEIDAVGRQRGGGFGGGHDEREQTLNQLLVELDGFDSNEGVILIAATNRPDVLDKALLRPGRFDRHIVIDLPDLKGRFEILKVHAAKIRLDDSVDLMHISRRTPGCSGADLANILNEAALVAARKSRSAVSMLELLEACDKVRYGKERRSLEIDQEERRNTAIHEAGHALVALCVEHADPLEKVTVIPRGVSLGATHFTPKKNRLSYWRSELLDQLSMIMGGRVAEDIFIGDISSGARADLIQATELARAMVCEWGMNTQLGPVSYDKPDNGLGAKVQNYSDCTAQRIDHEVQTLLSDAHERAYQILSKREEAVLALVDALLEFEVLVCEEVVAILEGKWNPAHKRASLLATNISTKDPQEALETLNSANETTGSTGALSVPLPL